jgi:NADH:ubiquinone reductase (H+-translocating)
LYILMGLQNRFIVFVRWTVSFITRGRGAAAAPGARASQAEAPAGVTGCHMEGSAAWPG